MSESTVTDVVFRVWPVGGVLALFPGELGDCDKPWTCNSYAHVGQHASADYTLCIRATRAATPEEYASLKRELESPPYEYKLRVLKRASGQHYWQRKAQC